MGNMKFPIVVKNSSIDFILIGRIGDETGVISKNHRSNIDFIGECRDIIANDQKDKKTNLNFFHNCLNLLGFSDFQNIDIHYLKSITVTTEDGREAYYNFLWRGYCSQQELSIVKKRLDLSITSLLEAYENRNINKFIWNLSTLMFVCSRANKTGQLWRLVLRFLLKLLIVLILSLIILSIYLPLILSLIH